MASNYNRKSASSGSRRKPPSQGSSRGAGRAARPARLGADAYRAMPGGRYAAPEARRAPAQRLTSVRVGDLDRAERRARAQSTRRRRLVRLGVAVGVVCALVAGAVAVYHSSLFAIEEVRVTGVEHLTSAEMSALAAVPSGTTLLRVDADGIKRRLMKDAWVQDVEVKRVFPNTLELAVTERQIAAIVEIPSADAKSVQPWAIASDHMWLMPIPERDSEAGRRISAQVYADADAALRITDVPFGTKAEVGSYCSDESVSNALDIVSGMTTSLAGSVKAVHASGAEETRLILEVDGSEVEVAFGKAEDIRDKERVCLELLEENPGTISYINVRVVERPTWRAL